MGAGTERSQKAAMESLAPLAGEIRSAAADGMPVFFAGTAMELLGAAITDSSGASFDGIGLANFTSVQGTHRFVEDVYGHDGPLSRSRRGLYEQVFRDSRRPDAAPDLFGHGLRQ